MIAMSMVLPNAADAWPPPGETKRFSGEVLTGRHQRAVAGVDQPVGVELGRALHDRVGLAGQELPVAA